MRYSFWKRAGSVLLCAGLLFSNAGEVLSYDEMIVEDVFEDTGVLSDAAGAVPEESSEDDPELLSDSLFMPETETEAESVIIEDDEYQEINEI